MIENCAEAENMCQENPKDTAQINVLVQAYGSFAYSALASFRIGMSESEGKPHHEFKATPGQERKSLGCLHPATPKANRPEPDRSKDRRRLVPAACL